MDDEERITVVLDEKTKKRIQKASKLDQRSVSGFVRKATLDRVNEILGDKNVN